MTDERQARILASNRRWRVIFAVLAVVVPVLLFSLFRRQELRLEGLVDHGRTAEAKLVFVSRSNGGTYSHYAYVVEGMTHEWSVSRNDAPYAIGESFPVTYLPEDASLSRPFVPYSRDRFESEFNRPLTRGFPLGAFVFFGGAALLCHRAIRRQQRGEPIALVRSVSPDTAGRALAILFLAIVVGVNFDPKVAAVFTALLGPRPLGLPPIVIVTVAEIVLFAPAFVVLPHFMRIVMMSRERGGGLSKGAMIGAVFQAPPELARSRNIVLAGAAYFFLVLGGWIALASAKGI